MIEKIAEYIQEPGKDEIFTVLDSSKKSLHRVKTANYADEVASYIKNLKQENDHLYALINALTAGEYYSSNKNGDYFPEAALKQHHPTFVEHGYVYKHHVNKDPKKSMGKVIFSHYNDKMKRVELVVKLKRSHPDVENILKQMGQGRIIKTSMGCRVPYDVCSITGKRAKTRSDYSPYLKTQMNQILPDGRKVCAINETPTFFDISIVTIPADPVSAFMGIFGLDKTAESQKHAGDKIADIKKKIDGEIDWLAEDPKGLILASQPRLTEETVEKLAAYPLNETLSTFLGLRILPTREDFQKLALYHIGKKDLAQQLEKQGFVFDAPLDINADTPEKVGPEWASEKIANEISQDISQLSLTKTNIINRIIKHANLGDIPEPLPKQDRERSFIKRLFFDEPEVQPENSGVKNPLIPYTVLGTMYSGYAKLLGDSANASSFTKFVRQHPWAAPLIGGSIALGLTQMQKNILNENNPDITKTAKVSPYIGSFLVSTPVSYYSSAQAELKARRGQRLDNVEETVRKHPFLTAVAGGLAGGALLKSIGRSTGRLPKKKKRGAGARFGGVHTDNFGKVASELPDLNQETINLIFKELTS